MRISGGSAAEVWGYTTKQTTGIKTTGQTVFVEQIVDNDANYVTVCDITGSGILLYVGEVSQTSGVICTLKLTIDGSILETDEIDYNPNTLGFVTFPMMLGFSSSCKVEMKLSGAGSSRFMAGVIYA